MATAGPTRARARRPTSRGRRGRGRAGRESRRPRRTGRGFAGRCRRTPAGRPRSLRGWRGELRRMRGGPVSFDDVRDVGRISGRFVELEGRCAGDIEFVDRRDCCPTFGVELLDVRALDVAVVGRAVLGEHHRRRFDIPIRADRPVRLPRLPVGFRLLRPRSSASGYSSGHPFVVTAVVTQLGEDVAPVDLRLGGFFLRSGLGAGRFFTPSATFGLGHRGAVAGGEPADRGIGPAARGLRSLLAEDGVAPWARDVRAIRDDGPNDPRLGRRAQRETFAPRAVRW